MCAYILALLEEEQNSRQVIESLELSGYKVIRAKNFNEAIRVLRDVRVDSAVLIISDVHLQNGGNVFDFLRWVKRNADTQEVPFVLFSSNPSILAKYLEDGLRTTSRLLGATMFMTMEPFDQAEFRRKIESLLPEVPRHELTAKGCSE